MLLFSLLFQADPLLPIGQYGMAVGSAIICVGLFIWSQIQIATFKTTVESNTKSVNDSNNSLRKLVETQSAAQDKLVESVHQLAGGIKLQSDIQREQLDLIRDMAAEQRVLSANQLTIMNGFQRVVEQLISAVRDE